MKNTILFCLFTFQLIYVFSQDNTQSIDTSYQAFDISEHALNEKGSTVLFSGEIHEVYKNGNLRMTGKSIDGKFE